MLKKIRRILSDRHLFDATAAMFNVSSYEMTGPVLREQAPADVDNLSELAALIMDDEVTVESEPSAIVNLMTPSELRRAMMLSASIIMKSMDDNGLKSGTVNDHLVSCFGNLDIYEHEHGSERLVSLMDVQAMDDPEVVATTHLAFEGAIAEINHMNYGV
jgi:hypothetical protein